MSPYLSSRSFPSSVITQFPPLAMAIHSRMSVIVTSPRSSVGYSTGFWASSTVLGSSSTPIRCAMSSAASR